MLLKQHLCVTETSAFDLQTFVPEEGMYGDRPVAAGRIPEVTGFSASLIELPIASNVWKFKTDVHIISPSFYLPS